MLSALHFLTMTPTNQAPRKPPVIPTEGRPQQFYDESVPVCENDPDLI